MKFKAFGTGRLGKDAEVTNFENGRSVIEFSAASNSYYKNKEGEKITDTEWYDVKIFVKTVNQSFSIMKFFVFKTMELPICTNFRHCSHEKITTICRRYLRYT